MGVGERKPNWVQNLLPESNCRMTLAWVFQRAESKTEACTTNRRKGAPRKGDWGAGEWSRETGRRVQAAAGPTLLNVTDCPLSLDHSLQSWVHFISASSILYGRAGEMYSPLSNSHRSKLAPWGCNPPPQFQLPMPGCQTQYRRGSQQDVDRKPWGWNQEALR